MNTIPVAKSGFKQFLKLFGCLYLFFYLFPFPLNIVPYVNLVVTWFNYPFDLLTTFIAKILFGVDGLSQTISGSGDTLYDYITSVTFILISLIVSFTLVLFNRKKNDYSLFYKLMYVYTRYFLGSTLLTYGLIKIFAGQFIFPDHFRLNETFGESSPMGLLWTFMGYSKPFEIFCGSMQVLAGFLLFSKRTTLLGSLLSIVIFTHIVALNFCYDVPVKHFSLHLLLFSFVIMWPYKTALFDLFIHGKATSLTHIQIDLQKKWQRVTRLIIKIVFIIGLPVLIIITQLMYMFSNDSNWEYDCYEVKELVLSGNKSGFKKETAEWKRLLIRKNNNYGYIYNSNGEETSWTVLLKKAGDSIYINHNSAKSIAVPFKKTNETNFQIEGPFAGDTIKVVLKKKRLEDYPLVQSQFHWIQEYPYNR